MLVSLETGLNHDDFLAELYEVWDNSNGVICDNDYVRALRVATGFDNLALWFNEENEKWVLARVVRGTPTDPRIVHVLRSWPRDEQGPTCDEMRRSLETQDVIARRQSKALADRASRMAALDVARGEKCKEIGKLLLKRGADPRHPDMQKWLGGSYRVPVTPEELAQSEEIRQRNYAPRKIISDGGKS